MRGRGRKAKERKGEEVRREGEEKEERKSERTEAGKEE